MGLTALDFTPRQQFRRPNDRGKFHIEFEDVMACSPGFAYLVNEATGKASRWTPTYQDLTADDWEICDWFPEEKK